MPTATVKTKMVVLWADEIRLAAQALKRVHEIPDGTPEAEADALVRAFVNAAWCALDGAEDEDAVLLLTTKPIERTEG